MQPPRVIVRVHLSGAPEERVTPLVRGAERVVWATDRAPADAEPVQARALRGLLGQTIDALVLDLRGDALDLELLAVGAGLVRGGGRIVLVLDPEGPLAGRAPSMAIAPFGPDAVGRRSYDRLLARVPEAPASLPDVPARVPTEANADVERLATELAACFAQTAPTRTALLADRGRGKSSTVGMALARCDRSVVVSAGTEDALIELLRFAGRGPRFVRPTELAERDAGADVVVIDEAAQLPISLLRRIAERQAHAHLVWISTTGGYEGTGRGLVLRFLSWARERGPLAEPRLQAPIRWGSGDPVEPLVRDTFALEGTIDPAPIGDVNVEVTHLSPDALAADEPTLRQVVALLSWAHYRTTPGDVARLLDAPNLSLHVARIGGVVVGVNLVAREGGLDVEAAQRAARTRLRGHALADTLASHSARPDAATLTMRRSVRIAVHPEMRRAGIARALTEHVHRTEGAALFGTLFGATAELVRFRQRLGYVVVRLGASRGARSGEPSVVMLRPVTAPARALVDALRAELAADLPAQLELLSHEEPVGPRLAAVLAEGLPPQVTPSEAEARARVARYLKSAQPIEACIGHARAFALAHLAVVPVLAPEDRALIEARVISLRSWREAASAAGLGVPDAQRRMRPALASLFAASERTAPSGVPRRG